MSKIEVRRAQYVKERKRRLIEYWYSDDVYENIAKRRASSDKLMQRSARTMDGSVRRNHQKFALIVLGNGHGEAAVHDCLCGCRESVLKLFRQRRRGIYAALWSLLQGKPGEAWGDIFVGGLGQMMWTFPL